MIKDRKSCNRTHAGWPQGHAAKLGWVNARAVVGNRELESASLHKTGNGQRSRAREASTGAEKRSESRMGFPGVKGDSARGKNRRELGRAAAVVGGWCPGQPDSGINNRVRCRGRQSERPIVAMKRVTTVERRGLNARGAESEGRVA
jgi:hypothetical protein